MTLVLYVPWQGGAILLSDRQGTTRTLTRTPLDKLSIIKPDEIALGYAGSTHKCDYLVRKLSSELLSPDNFPDDYRRVYATCYHLPELGFEMGDVSLIAVAINDARELRVYRVLDAVANLVDSSRCWGIGSGVGLFIVAGVAQALITGVFSWIPDPQGMPAGLLFRWAWMSQNFGAQLLTSGGMSFLFIQGGGRKQMAAST